MKNIFSFILIFISLLIFSQEEIVFETSSFKDILAKAKKENKLVFIDAYASWCGPCKMMEKNVFPKQSVKKLYNTSFINARFDMEKGEGRDIAKKYAVYSYPTYLFLNGDGEVVFKGMGYLEEDAFLALGKEADAVGRGGSAKERFARGERNPDFLLNAIKLNANTDPEFAKKVSERYFQNRKNKGYTQDEISMLLYFLRSTSDTNYKTFVADKAEIIKVLPEETYNQFDKQMKVNAVVEKSVNRQSGTINEALFLSEVSRIIGEAEAEQTLIRIKVNFLPSVGKFSEYGKIALEYYGTGEGFDGNELGKAAYIFSEHITNKDALKKALIWAEKSVMNNETPENTYILAKLYQKTGNNEAAKMYALHSLNLTKQKGMDATLTEKLLSELK